MTTVYLVEVKIDKHVHYMGGAGWIGTIPKFFNNSTRVKNLLRNPSPGYGNSRYQTNHKDAASVIQIKNVELGMKHSFATIMTVDEFMARDFSTNALKIPNNPRAIYMIELAPDMSLAKPLGPIYVKKAGRHSSRAKFGHQWNEGGHVRAHISQRIMRLGHGGQYRGAKVLEIEMMEDGFTPKTVKSYPIVDFYCASPAGRVKYNLHHQPYQPTSPEYA